MEEKSGHILALVVKHTGTLGQVSVSLSHSGDTVKVREGPHNLREASLFSLTFPYLSL